MQEAGETEPGAGRNPLQGRSAQRRGSPEPIFETSFSEVYLIIWPTSGLFPYLKLCSTTSSDDCFQLRMSAGSAPCHTVIIIASWNFRIVSLIEDRSCTQPGNEKWELIF